MTLDSQLEKENSKEVIRLYSEFSEDEKSRFKIAKYCGGWCHPQKISPYQYRDEMRTRVLTNLNQYLKINVENSEYIDKPDLKTYQKFETKKNIEKQREEIIKNKYSHLSFYQRTYKQVLNILHLK